MRCSARFLKVLSQQHATVDGGERAVIFDRFRGVLPEVVSEGTHLRIPWVQTPHVMDIRTRPRTISSVTGTKGEVGGGRGVRVEGGHE
jgi:prohibitin 1